VCGVSALKDKRRQKKGFSKPCCFERTGRDYPKTQENTRNARFVRGNKERSCNRGGKKNELATLREAKMEGNGQVGLGDPCVYNQRWFRQLSTHQRKAVPLFKRGSKGKRTKRKRKGGNREYGGRSIADLGEGGSRALTFTEWLRLGGPPSGKRGDGKSFGIWSVLSMPS